MFNLESRITSLLRRLFVQMPNYSSALNAAKIKTPVIKKDGTKGKSYRVSFLCRQCLNAFPKKEVAVDHINPVGSRVGSKFASKDVTWDSYIKRLFCDLGNLQVLCSECHKKKSALEKGKYKW